MRRTLALVVEYDGGGFHGFQRQTAQTTVAGELENALASLFRHPVRIVAAGRTDTGVHATGQVVSLDTTSDFPLERIPIAASAMLRDKQIAVLRAVERGSGFSARHHALSRTYRYRILNRPAPSVLLRGRVFHVRARLDLEAMRAAARELLGRRDFAALSAGPPHQRGTVREIRRLEISKVEDVVHIVITADAFLHQMARIAVGTIIEIGRGRRAIEDIGRTLESRDRANAGFAAPAHALCLESVEYDPPV